MKILENNSRQTSSRMFLFFVCLLGFQLGTKAQSTYYVNDNSLTGDVYTTAIGNDVTGTGTAAAPYATITKAITVAPAGSTIKVDAGTYIAALGISKSLTLMGANYGAVGNGVRVSESIIKDSKITISGTGAIIIDGFHIYQTTAATGATVEVNNTPTTIRNNKIERVGATNGVNAVGIQTASGVTSAIVITRNFITGSNAGGLFSTHRTWNSGIYSNGGSSIAITYNQFTTCRTAINSDNMSAGVSINNNGFSSNGTHISFGGSGSTTGSYTLSSNTFSITLGNTTFNCSNVATSFRLDVSNNTFGSTLASAMSLSECFSLESSIVHKGVSSKNGLVTFQSGKLFKSSTSTMANNISYANAGDIIYVSSGTISESITVNKALKIYGNNYAVNPNDASWNYNASRATESVISNNSITIASSNVEFMGFKITGCTNNMAIGNTNPAASYSNITIKNNWITSNSNVRGIWFTASSGQAYDGLIIQNNRIENNTYSSATAQISGIDLWRSGNHSISGNYISGANYNGIHSDGYQTNTVSGNKIINCKIAGITIQSTYANGQVVSVSDNNISGCQEGITVWSSTTTYPNIKFQISNNTLAINASKLDINYPAINVSNISSGDGSANVISGNSVTYSGTVGSSPYGFMPGGPATAAYAVAVSGNVGNLQIQNNLLDGGNVNGSGVSNAALDMAGLIICSALPILDNSNPVNTALSGNVSFTNNDIRNFKNGVSVFDFVANTLGNIPSGSSVSVNNNSIVPRTGGLAITSGNLGTALAATCNWYGSASYTDVSALINGNASYISFLVSGTDNNLSATGFQPASGTCTGVAITTPTLGASAGVFQAIGQNSFSFTFTKGNGTKRAIFVKAGSALSLNPSNNTVYTTSTVFGSGSQLDNASCVYADTGNTVSVSNLQPNTTYYISIYEYNSADALIQYASSLVYTFSVSTLQPDADNDGVADADDQYPNDPFKAFNNLYPAAGFGTLMYEDLWPAKGDYDFNDLVVDYRMNTITDADNNVVEVKYTFVTRAVGGSLHNGFAFQLDGINPNKITSVSGSKAAGAAWISLNGNGTEAGQGSHANILVFDDAYKLLASHTGYSYVNVVPGSPNSGTDTTYITVKFMVDGLAPAGGKLNYTDFSTALFNPYLIAGQDRGKEIHLADRVYTNKMNTSYLGRDQDRTNASTGKYFKTENNLPWGINIGTSIPFSIEKTDISEAYLKFIDWATSGGSSSANWYQNIEGNRNNNKLMNR